MEYLLQGDILSIVLLSFEENTLEKKERIRSLYEHFDKSLIDTPKEELNKICEFISFINSLYTEEDYAIKSILCVLYNEVKKELDFQLEIESEKEPALF